MKRTRWWRVLVAAVIAAAVPSAGWSESRQVVVISLDGAKPDLIRQYLQSGVLDKRTGLGRLSKHGVVADQNITATPSLTAVSHIAIATGSTSAHNDIPANTFHPVAAGIGTGISGFAAPIGGYALSPLGPDPTPTAEPMWEPIRNAGKSVVTATWPGADGADIRITGTLVQAAEPIRTNCSGAGGAGRGLRRAPGRARPRRRTAGGRRGRAGQRSAGGGRCAEAAAGGARGRVGGGGVRAGGRAREAQPALVDGAVGAVWAPGGRPRAVFRFTVPDETIAGIDVIVDPKGVRGCKVVVLAE